MQTRKRLKAKTPLRHYSERRVRQLNGEVTARILLCKRCGGTPIQNSRMVKVAGNHLIELTTILCLGGTCEVCGKPAGDECMSPHEKTLKSRGGKVSLENSVMCHWQPCHKREQGSEPMWSKDDCPQNDGSAEPEFYQFLIDNKDNPDFMKGVRF